MWRIWFFFGILEISFGAPVKTNQGEGAPSTELVVLKCLLSSPLNSCDDVKRTVEKIPKRIQKLYEKLKRPLKDVTSNDSNGNLDLDALDTVPISLLYLIPKIRLYSMSGLTASKLVRKFPLDAALTMKILGAMTNDTKIQDFLNGLSKYDETYKSDFDGLEEDTTLRDIPFISPAVEEEIGVALSKWFPNGTHWEFWLFEASMMSGSPILASLPSYFLNALSLKTTEKFLYHLRNWRWDQNYPSYFEDYSTSAILWTRHSMAIRRIWAHVVLTKAERPSRWSPRLLNQLGFLLTGATPDELRNLPESLRQSHSFHILLQMNWSPLQARSVFDALYSSATELGGNDLNNVKNMVFNLLPRQLQQFSQNETSFEFVMKTDDKISLAAKKQIFEMQLAHIYLRNRTKGVQPSELERKVASLGKFIHVAPATQLQSFMNETFDLKTLGNIDSNYLTYRQVRYLTKSGGIVDFHTENKEAIFSLKSFLKCVPSLKLAQVSPDRLFQNVKQHLLMFTSGDSTIAMATILEKVRSEFADISFLEKMLYNKDYLQYFNLLGSRDITRKFKDISSNLFILVNKDPNLERNIRLLPYNTLYSLLSFYRQAAIASEGGWTYENLIDSPLKMYISGLSCSDVEHLETSDFLPVIGYYVRHRRALGQVFPKNMQSCSQYALVEYLKLKAQLLEVHFDSESIFNFLESFEIKAVGGYILAGLPIDVILSHPRKQQIAAEVGKLTIPELLTSTSVTNLKALADGYYYEPTAFRLRAISELGNLIWFLSDEKVRRIDSDDFKLFIESLEENTIKALCFSESERHTWKLFLTQVFGNPSSWSAGTLKVLGDLLIVFERHELAQVNRTSWVESADFLAQSTSFYHLMEWPGKTKAIYLYEVCSEVLDASEILSYKEAVRNVLRLYLESAQFLLNTIVPADGLLKFHEEPSQKENIKKLHFIPSLLTSQQPDLDLESALDIHSGQRVKQETSTVNSETTTTEVKTEDQQPVEEESKIEPKTYGDMVQNDQEIREEGEEEEEENEDYDYDYDADYSPAHHHSDYDAVQVHEPISEVLTEAEASERVKRLFDRLDFLNFFKRSKTEGDSSQKRDRRSINGGGEVLEEGKEDEKSIKIFRSQDLKSLEEKKTELRINGSRDLVIEVPQSINRTSKIGCNCTRKQPVKITCDAIRILGKSASLVLDRDDISSMSDDELEDCSEVLGSIELEPELRRDVWRRLKEWKQSGNLLEVGNLVSAIEEHEIPDIKLDLSEPWAYENLYALSKHVTDPFTMSQASDEFLLKNINMSVLTYEAGAALGRLVCTMTLAHQRKLLLSQSPVFVNVASILGGTIECNNKIFESCIYQLAKISTSEEAFGHTRDWDAADVSTLGIILAGLPKEYWRDENGNGLRPEALEGLTPSAIACTPPETLKVLSEEQLLRLPAMTAAALTPSQTSVLSPSQLAALNRVRREITLEDLNESLMSGASERIPMSAAIYVTMTVCINLITARTFN